MGADPTAVERDILERPRVCALFTLNVKRTVHREALAGTDLKGGAGHETRYCGSVQSTILHWRGSRPAFLRSSVLQLRGTRILTPAVVDWPISNHSGRASGTAVAD